MARIFYGRREMLDDAVLEAVKQLNDDFWVLAEFDLDRRNVDWLIIRAVPDSCPAGRFSTLYLTELKRTSAQLSGGESGRWTAERNGVAREIVPNNKADENHWQQVANVARVVQGWLYINQRRFLSPSHPEYPESAFRLWPTLLILSTPPDLPHRLPLMPANRQGSFHFQLDRWLDSVQCCAGKEGIRLSGEELARLVATIGLEELSPPSASPQPREATAGASGDLAWLQDFSRWVTGIEERLTHLEERQQLQLSVERVVLSLSERLKRLENELTKATPSAQEKAQPHVTVATPKKAPTQANGGTPEGKIVSKVIKDATKPAKVITKPEKDRALTDDERSHLTEALTAVRLAGKVRTVSNVVLEMDRILGGESLKHRKYNGFGTAKAMFDRAKKEKLIRYGPVDATNMATIYFFNEVVPKKAPVP